ncbi:MAG: lectin-like protein, partial [Roseomonas sp.]
MRQLTLTEWQQLNDAASRGDRLTYWTVLQGAGDRYAFLAGQVVTDVALAGRVANRHFVSIVSESRGTPVTANEVHEFGVQLIRADLDARRMAVGAGSITELLDLTAGAALRANAPELSARAVRDAHVVAAQEINVTTHGWTLEATFAAFENNPVVLDRVWNRFLDLSLTSPMQAGGLMNGLLEGLILKAEGYPPAQLQSHLANRFGGEVAEFVAQADVSGRTADGRPLVSALQDTYRAIGRGGNLLDALDSDPVYIPPGMSRIEAMLETAEMRDRARALNPATPPRCFAAGTPILMADGTTKPIEDIRVGDLVMAFAEDAAAGHGDLAPRKVVRLYRNVTKEWIEISPAADHAPRAAKQGFTKAYVTPGHRVMTASGQFMRADAAVAANAPLAMADGSAVEIKAQRIGYEADTAALFEQAEQFSYGHDGNTALAPAIEQGWRTYNFEVEERHTYIAAGLRVHNDSLGAAMQLGSSIGSFIADQMLMATGHDNIALRFGVGAVAGRLGQWVGANIHDVLVGADSSRHENVTTLFDPGHMSAALATQAVNMAGAALARGLLRSLNLDGNPVLNAVGSILGGTVAQAAAWQAVKLVVDPATLVQLADVKLFGSSLNAAGQPVAPNLGFMVGSAAASFVGAWAGTELAKALVDGDPKAMSIGSSVGSMVGTFAAQILFASLVAGPAGWAVIGIAAFIGAFAGGSLAGVFSKKKVPRGHAWVDDDGAGALHIPLGGSGGTGGGESPARNLAQSAIQVSEALLRMAGVEKVNNINAAHFFVDGGRRGFRWNGQTHQTGGGKKLDLSDPSAMVEYGAIKLLHASNAGAIQSEGDFLLTRVLRNTDSTSLKGVEADFRLAFAYAGYQDNRALFESLGATETRNAFVNEFNQATGRNDTWEQMKARAEGVLDLDGGFTADVWDSNGKLVSPGYMRGRAFEQISDLGNVAVQSITPAAAAPDPENLGLNTSQTAWSKPLIVIDLNGDGVGAFQANETGVLFDFDDDGFREETAWISPWDAFLVWDRNNDGNIGDIGEMILGGVADASDVFVQLAELDSTNDAYFDANDTNFFNVRLWTDRNFNGSVDFGELWSLTKFGLERIALTGKSLDAEGEIVGDPDSPLMVWGDAANPLWSGKYSSRQPNETLQIGGLASLQLSYGQLGVKTVIDPNAPGWVLLEHEGGTRTAVGASSTLGALNSVQNLRTLMGGEGNDSLSPGLPDQANPTAGVRLGGGMGNDTLVGTSGGDVISGDGGVDSIFAGAGDDVVIADASDNLAHMRGGDGFDVLVLEGTLGRTVDLAGTGFEAALGSDGAEYIRSTGADFVILGGGGGNDTLEGTGNADRLEGDAGADYLIAGNGDDLLVGGAGADTLIGGNGNDIITADAADFNGGSVSGDDGFDLLLIDGFEGVRADASALKVEEIEGSDGGDWLDVGNDGVSRRIAGAGGDDTLVAGFGNDTLEGGDGSDVASFQRATSAVSLNLGAATLIGIGGRTTLKDFEGAIGSGFADTIIGQNSLTENWIEGGAGADSLDGAGGFDILSYASSAGAVTVNLVTSSASGGDAAGDVIRDFEGAMGSAQADSLLGSSVANLLSGGAGADTLDGGAGSDTLSYAYASGGVTVNLATGRGEAGEATGDVFSNFEAIEGSDHADVFRAAGRAFNYAGGLGADMVSYAALAGSGITVDLTANRGIGGAALNDTYAGIEIIEGTSGADSLRGGTAAETLIGGVGADTLDAGGGGGRLEGGAGDDVYHFGRGSGLFEIADASGLDRLRLGAGINAADLIVQSVNGDLMIGLRPFGADWLQGGAIVDQVTIRGGAGSAGRIERLMIGDGASAIEAFVQVAPDGEGTRLVGSTGTNLMVGGTGNDTLESTEGEGWLYGGAGNDFLSSGVWDDILDGGDGNDTQISGNGNDTLLGGNGNDLLDGGNGNDLIFGDDGNDTLRGGAGDDTLLGGAGNDLLIGDGGDDVLRGGAGNNTLIGGTGWDRYQVVQGDGQNWVYDSDGSGRLDFVVNTYFENVRNTNDLNVNFRNWSNFVGISANYVPNSLDHGMWAWNPGGGISASSRWGKRFDFHVGNGGTPHFFGPYWGVWGWGSSPQYSSLMNVFPQITFGILPQGLRRNYTGAPLGAFVAVDGSTELTALWPHSGRENIVFNNGVAAPGESIFERNGRYYVVSANKMTWPEAQAWARAKGGDLVTVNDAAEDEALRFMLSPWLTGWGGGEIQNLWIGLTDSVQEGVWRWSNGEPVTYTRWAPGQPDNRLGDDDYAYMNGSHTGGLLRDRFGYGPGWGDAPGAARWEDVSYPAENGYETQHELVSYSFRAIAEIPITGKEWDYLGGFKVDFRRGWGVSPWNDDRIRRIASATRVTDLNALLNILPFEGQDFLNGSNQADWMHSGNGADELRGNAGADTLYGGAGDDRIYGGSEADLLVGENGADLIHGGTNADTLYGGEGGDTLDGATGNDLLDGQWDNDIIGGGTGDDTLYGNFGSDKLDGDSGNDFVSGAEESDTISGGAGHDSLFGGIASDLLNGGDDDDLLYGDDGSDSLLGGNGADKLYGGNGDDQLDGGEGHDLLSGDAGRDTIFGAGGNDTLLSFNGLEYIASYGDLVAAFGANAHAGISHFVTDGVHEGRKTNFDGLAYIASHPDLIAAFGANAEAGVGHYFAHGMTQGRQVTATNPEIVTARLGAGAASRNRGDRLSGGAGDDLVVASFGDDSITGGNGNDRIWGASGQD